MQLRSLVPSIVALSACALGSAQAQDLGSGIGIGGFVDAILNVSDTSIDDLLPGEEEPDTSIDFTAAAVLQFMAQVTEGVSLQVDLNIDGDENTVTSRQAFITWEATDTFTLQFGKSISYIGFQAAYAPGLWRIGVTPYLASPVYGVDFIGVWGTFSASDNIHITLALIDEIYGPAAESDSLAVGGQAVIGVEGYGSVEVELQFDPNGASAWDAAAEDDAAAFGLVVHTTADKLVEGWTFGGEIAYTDFDTAASLAAMAMANFAFSERASVTGMLSYYEPNDDVDDDELIEIAVALLTTPTGSSNFAVNAELSFITGENEDTIYFGIEALAIIP